MTLTNIPPVEPSAFKPYLSQVGSLYDAFQQAKAIRKGDGGRSRGRRKDLGDTGGTHSPLSAEAKKLSSGILPLSSQNVLDASTTRPALKPELRRNSTDGQKKGFTHNVPNLSTIPTVYFEEDFHLENPRTFDVVSERSDVVIQPSRTAETESDVKGGIEMNGLAIQSTPKPRKTLATNAILQEKLSWYMDTVEVHLISSISSASTSFFAALDSLRALNSETEVSVKRIQALRAELNRVDKDMALGGLAVLNMRRRRANVEKLSASIEQLGHILKVARTCHNLVERGDIEQALQEVDNLEGLVAGRAPEGRSVNESEPRSSTHTPLADLRGLKALASFSDDLRNLKSLIGRGFETRFVDVLLGDLRRHVQSVPLLETLQRWDAAKQRSRTGHTRTISTTESTSTHDNELRTRLKSNLDALDRLHFTQSAIITYREAILREVKAVIRNYLPSSDDDDTASMTSMSTRGGRQRTQQEKSSILARNLRALDPDEAEELFRKMYCAIGEMMRKLAVQVKILLDMTSITSYGSFSTDNKLLSQNTSLSMEGKVNTIGSTSNASITPKGDGTQYIDVSSIVGEAVDVAQAQIIKILKVRSDQTIHLPIQSFIRYVTLNRSIADECEIISGRGGSALKSLVNGYIKDFVAELGDTEKQILARSMDADSWDAADFGEKESQILSKILDSSTKDPEMWIRGSNLLNGDGLASTTEHAANGTTINGSMSGNGNVNGKEKVRRAIIDDQTFILPKSALAVLAGVEKFATIIACIPSATQDVSIILLEYFKLFNSRSCQLILGAGATRSAGLKNITTKHLALASQALSFIITIIPYIREYVRRHPMQSNTLMIEFDKVKRLYQEHQTGIQDKLIEIMSSRSRTHISA